MSELTFKCWNCGAMVTAIERAESDGECPECQVEMCLVGYCESYQNKIAQLEKENAEQQERISELEKEKYESIDAWNSQLEKASARVKELEQEYAELKARVAELEKSNNNLFFAGYTNGSQILYSLEGEGSFYNDTSNECYIPLYMLKQHEHRLTNHLNGSVDFNLISEIREKLTPPEGK